MSESQTVTVTAEQAEAALKAIENLTGYIRTMRDKEARIVELMKQVRTVAKPILERLKGIEGLAVLKAQRKVVEAQIAEKEKPIREEADTATKELRVEAANERAELKGVKGALYEAVSH